MNSGFQAIDPEIAWLAAADAMRDFLPGQRSIIDSVSENTDRIVAEQAGKAHKALTLDNGPDAYPTIVFSFRGAPSDSLVVAHEFAHALQIRASSGKFVPPLVREVCAFLGERALLSYVARSDAAQYNNLIRTWEDDNKRYFGAQRRHLRAALLQPDSPYKYSWNYPIARYLAIQIHARCAPDWIWGLFEGAMTVRGVLRELALFRK